MNKITMADITYGGDPPNFCTHFSKISFLGAGLFKNGYKLFESTGKVVEIQSWLVIDDAYAESGHSHSTIVNKEGEAIGIHYVSDREDTPDKKLIVYTL